MTVNKTETPTAVIRWHQTHDLDNFTSARLQQSWEIVTYDENGVISREREWRYIEVFDGGLEV